MNANKARIMFYNVSQGSRIEYKVIPVEKKEFEPGSIEFVINFIKSIKGLIVFRPILKILSCDEREINFIDPIMERLQQQSPFATLQVFIFIRPYRK